jgi:stage V sporulation protein G
VEISEIRIKLMDDIKDSRNERLLAFCSVTFDNMFVVRDLKIIEGAKGLFVAMPSRKLTDRCGGCGCKNHLRSRFCNNCGGRLNEDRAPRDVDGRAKLHADVAHPINSAAREFVQGSILRSFHEELDRSKLPGYVCRYDEVDAGDYDETLDAAPVARGGDLRRHAPHEPRPTPVPRQGSQPAAPERTGANFGSGVFE